MNKCPITKEIIKHPVFCPLTGYIYEKDAIQREINENKKCPITGIEISFDDLMEVKTPNEIIVTNEKSDKNFSIEDSLKRIEAEYNSLIYKKFFLSKELNKTQRELCEKQIQNQAAKIVISRLLKEKEEALEILKEYQNKMEEDN